ncbi:MAG: BlaI/MecI/CopY family transcriptional regulator [Actinomycetia bacterium]|nr:BlaI/MecI/CopY family transcriptional regulator [Actinomycetes bacterium]
MSKDPFLENAVMDVLWGADDSLTPRNVQAQLPAERTVEYTTVMTVLARLWKKGRLNRERRGRAYAYAPVRTRSEHAAIRMEEILETAGDRSIALARFTEQLSASERRRLKLMLDEQ